MIRHTLAVALVALAVSACTPDEVAESEPLTTTTVTTTPTPDTTVEPAELAISSPSFGVGDPIPVKFTCDGLDINPQLDISGLPVGTMSLVLIVDDPDAPVGVWDHWVEYNIMTGSGEFTIEENSGSIGTEGLNSWNVTGYGGPCPPEGERHRYVFTVHALRSVLDLPPGIDSAGIREAMEGMVLDETAFVANYSR